MPLHTRTCSAAETTEVVPNKFLRNGSVNVPGRRLEVGTRSLLSTWTLSTSGYMDFVERLKQLLGLSSDKPKRDTKKSEPAAEQPKPAAPKAAKLLNLDASELLPITSDELRESLQDLIRSGGWRFTARGVIPVGDPRTRLINRALLTNGLLTPEQLDEINQIALDHERLQKGLAAIEQAAVRAGEAAVVADREGRAELKKQKKAEAEEPHPTARGSRRPAACADGHLLPGPRRRGAPRPAVKRPCQAHDA